MKGNVYQETMSNNLLDKNCYWCKKRLAGRADKKFCNEHCRNAANNARQAIENQIFSHTHKKLKANYRILQYFKDFEEIPVKHLQMQGFNPFYCTQILHIENQTFKLYDITFQWSPPLCFIIKNQKQANLS